MNVREDSNVDGDNREYDTGQSHCGELVDKLNSNIDDEAYWAITVIRRCQLNVIINGFYR